jgi:hypothetical protein
MFNVMALIQTSGGSVTREVGEFGGADGLQSAESWAAYWRTVPTVLLVWVA